MIKKDQISAQYTWIFIQFFSINRAIGAALLLLTFSVSGFCQSENEFDSWFIYNGFLIVAETKLSLSQYRFYPARGYQFTKRLNLQFGYLIIA